jgi:hypothetical protein
MSSWFYVPPINAIEEVIWKIEQQNNCTNIACNYAEKYRAHFSI